MQALGRDRRGAEASSHTRGLPIFKKRAVRKSTRSLPLSRFLLLLVVSSSVAIFFIRSSSTRPEAKEPADVPMQGVFADDPENLQVQQTQPSVHEPSVNVEEVEVEEEVLPEASGLYNLVAKDIDGEFQQLSQYAGSVTVVVNVASQ